MILFFLLYISETCKGLAFSSTYIVTLTKKYKQHCAAGGYNRNDYFDCAAPSCNYSCSEAVQVAYAKSEGFSPFLKLIALHPRKKQQRYAIRG